MAKFAIKSEKLTPFGGIFPIMDTALSFKTAWFFQKNHYFMAVQREV